jgi:hypothetical protein
MTNKHMLKLAPLLLTMAGLATAGPTAVEDTYLETIKVSENVYVFKPKIDWSHGNGVAIIAPEGVFFHRHISAVQLRRGGHSPAEESHEAPGEVRVQHALA